MFCKNFRAAWLRCLAGAIAAILTFGGCDVRTQPAGFGAAMAQTGQAETQNSAGAPQKPAAEAVETPDAGAGMLMQQLPQGVPEVLLRRKAYVCSYNPNTLQPNYVAWRLTAAHTDGPYDRKITGFHPDTDVPEPQITTRDYARSGYDRGHMCPAADNKWDETAMRECFLMSNICPQHPRLNQGDWQEIEQACRRWAIGLGEIWIVCGPVFMNRDHEMIGDAVRIPVPEAFFKVVLCTAGRKPRAIGFVCRNEAGNRTKSAYVNSPAEVERVTGIRFFPRLDAATRRAVWQEADLTAWPQ